MDFDLLNALVLCSRQSDKSHCSKNELLKFLFSKHEKYLNSYVFGKLMFIANQRSTALAVQSSKPIMSEEARGAGLVDAVVPVAQLVSTARKYALDIASGKQSWRRTLTLTDRMGSLEESLEIVKQAREKAKKTYRNVPHPFKMLDAIEEGIVNGGVAGTLKVLNLIISYISYQSQFLLMRKGHLSVESL